MGGLGWSPAQFWASTAHDYYAAVEYHERAAARLERARDNA